MRHLIDSVADLTALRDRDELEIIVTSVMFELIGAAKILLWRLVSRDGELRLQLRTTFESNRTTIADEPTGLGDLPTLGSRKDLRACYESGASMRIEPDQNAGYGHVFPVSNELGVIGFLEIFQSKPLREYQSRLISGFLRIYRNHLRILDYSENDELTGLLNRKTFDEFFGRFVRPVSQHANHSEEDACLQSPGFGDANRSSWLAVIDIDLFKRINDQFGHLYGDEVLVLLARLMLNSFREVDRLFRFGGEEFIIILRDTDPCLAATLMEDFRTAVEAFRFPQVGRVTVSIGYTRIVEYDNSSDAFGRADQALYVAKQNGRNQVRSHEALIAENVLQAKDLAEDSLELFA